MPTPLLALLLALPFEPATAPHQFVTRGPGYAFELTAQQAALQLSTSRLTMRLVGADPAAVLLPRQPLPGKVNYLIGDQPRHWRRNLPTCGQLHAANIYPGIDILYYRHAEQLEYDLLLAPAADPSRITLQFDGADSLRLAPDGSLLLATAAGELRWQRPVAYQLIDGQRRSVPAAYRLRSPRQVAFELGPYDPHLPLTIDPTFDYLAPLDAEQINAIKVDTFGQSYLVGTAQNDIYVAKLNSNGSAPLFITYLGGRGDDRGLGLALGNELIPSLYITGRTNSLNFPSINPFQPTLAGDYDAFFLKLSPDGQQIQLSSYFGGSAYDSAQDIALSADNQTVYLAGTTDSPDLPTLKPLQPAKFASSDGFLAAFSTNSSTRLYATYLGGPGEDSLAAVRVNAAGQAWVAGRTNSRELPVGARTQQPLPTGDFDCFVIGVSFDGASRVYSTYLGGSKYDACHALDLTPEGNIVVTGATDSPDFPLAIPTQAAPGGNRDIFVTELGPTGGIIFSTYLGGPRPDSANSVAVDASGVIHLAGETYGELPLLNPVSPNRSGSRSLTLRAPTAVANLTQPPSGLNAETALPLLAFSSGLTVYGSTASGRLHKSLDSGLTWNPLAGSPPSPTRFLAFSGPALFAATNLGLYSSTDDGATWTLRNPAPNPTGLAVNSTNSALYLATATGFLRSYDLGRSWSTTLAQTTRALTIDPNDPFRLHLATPTALLRSTDGGSTWSPISAQILSQVLAPANANQLYGHDTKRLYASANGGAAWTLPPLPFADDLLRLAVHPTDANHLLLATAATGIWRSLDAGLTWTLASPADATALDVAFSPAGPALASFSLSTDAVLARWGRLRPAPNRYTYYQASVTYFGTHRPDTATTVAADTNTIGTYIAGASGAGTYMLRFGPSPATCTYSFQPATNLLLPADGPAASVLTVLAPSGCPWTPTASAPWLEFHNPEPRTGSGELRFFALPNPTPRNRSATLSLAGQSLTVEQAGTACATATVTNLPTSFFSIGGTVTPTLNIPAECPWSAQSSAPWLTVATPNSGRGPARLSLVVAPNNANPARSATLRLGPQSFDITQSGLCRITFSPPALNVPTAGFSGTVELSTSQACPWSLTASDPGLTIDSVPTGAGPRTIAFTVAPNPLPTTRTINIVGPNASVAIRQNGSACTFNLDTTPRQLSPLSSSGTLTIPTQPNCFAVPTSDQPWLSLNGVSYQVTANLAVAPRTARITLGSQTQLVTQAGLPPQKPVVLPPTPASGSGVVQSFAFTFVDANGATDLNVLNVLIHSALDARQACYIAYVRPTNSFYLVPDSGEGLLPAGTPNSQCNITGNSVQLSDNSITLNLSLTFTASFAGNKVIYQAARDQAGNNTGWVPLGVWNVPSSALTAASVPSVNGMSPARWVGNRSFTFMFTDPNGFADLNVLNILINTALDARGACYLAYVRPTNTLYLVPDPGEGLLPAGQTENSQCRVLAQELSVSANANSLSLSLPIELKLPALRDRIVWAAARDLAGNNSGWQALGTVSVN